MKLVTVGLMAVLLLALSGCTGTGTREASPSTSRTSVSPSSLGSPLKHANAAFATCPDISQILPAGASPNDAASAVAIKFVLATPDVAVQLGDPVAAANGLIPHVPGSAEASLIGSVSARDDALVLLAFGRRVATRSWRVTVDDGT